MLVIGTQSSKRLRPLERVWPFLFVVAGLFLAAWSDKEMWPRGNLSWTWLIHHDAEARQHKIYAVLLVVMGIIECLRVNAKLNRFWRAWSFPVLAVLGIVLLLFHDHTGASSGSSREARKYVVYWLADRTTEAPVSESPSDLLPHDHRMMPAICTSGGLSATAGGGWTRRDRQAQRQWSAASHDGRNGKSRTRAPLVRLGWGSCCSVQSHP